MTGVGVENRAHAQVRPAAEQQSESTMAPTFNQSSRATPT